MYYKYVEALQLLEYLGLPAPRAVGYFYLRHFSVMSVST
jgi:hypothetical protein